MKTSRLSMNSVPLQITCINFSAGDATRQMLFIGMSDGRMAYYDWTAQAGVMQNTKDK